MVKVKRITEKQKEAFIASLELGTSITAAAKAADFNRDWYHRAQRSDKPEAIEFIKKCRLALDSRVCLVEDMLYKLALQGKLGAVIFWLCNRAPDRWSNTHFLERGSNDPNEIAQRIRDILALIQQGKQNGDNADKARTTT